MVKAMKAGGMNIKRTAQALAALVLLAAGCAAPPTSPAPAATAFPRAGDLSLYQFPGSIDAGGQFMFYLHGRIIEDQGLPAISPDFGEYQYLPILETLAGHGFTLISEQRPRGTDSEEYAGSVVDQVTRLLDAGVPPDAITVVGASKGAGIAALVSSRMENPLLKYVLLGFCSPDSIEQMQQNEAPLHGDVLAIRDSVDELSGSCSELFAYSDGRGLGRHHEIVLGIGTGHGILYQPLEAWVLPAVRWAEGQGAGSLSPEETATLDSLEQVDDYPLYSMHYSGDYTIRPSSYRISDPPITAHQAAGDACTSVWGCSLFASLGDEANRLYGRNFDWRFSPALLLFTDPSDGYASVSIVDLEYLGFGAQGSRDLDSLPPEQLAALLASPGLPFDGMNEKGIAIGMAAVPEQDLPRDPNKSTLDQLGVIREILDHASTVQEAVDILGSHNIDMGSVPVHYLVASSAGESALVEFYHGRMEVFRNQDPWQVATNFLVASVNANPKGQCWRYDLISRRLEELQGKISAEQALELLQHSSQDNTQWSVVYHMTGGGLDIVMGRDYSGEVLGFSLP